RVADRCDRHRTRRRRTPAIGRAGATAGAAAVTHAVRTAVVIPCFNEAVTIADVVADFRRALPDAVVWVFDNNSTDATVAVAQAAGARVARVALQGKGNVVRRMFADVDADIYVMVDGDGTYDAASAPALVQALRQENADMVVAA